MSKLTSFSPILTLFAFVASNGHSTTFDSAYIENFAKKYIENHITIQAGTKTEILVARIDARIKIKPCDLPLTANIPQNNIRRNVNVKISCNDSTPWQMYLPAKIITSLPVLVANETITKGILLDSSNIEIQYLQKNKIRGERLTDAKPVYGAKAKRRITKGGAITSKNICLVCKGDSVTIVAQSKTFTIKTAGIALSDGAQGQQIKVKNKQSGKTITAQVETVNKVVINL